MVAIWDVEIRRAVGTRKNEQTRKYRQQPKKTTDPRGSRAPRRAVTETNTVETDAVSGARGYDHQLHCCPDTPLFFE